MVGWNVYTDLCSSRVVMFLHMAMAMWKLFHLPCIYCHMYLYLDYTYSHVPHMQAALPGHFHCAAEVALEMNCEDYSYYYGGQNTLDLFLQG